MSGDRRRELEERLSAYLDDELGPQEQRDLEALLAVDAEARRLLDQLRATVEAVRSLPRARSPEHLVESLRARMERQSLLGGRPVPVHQRRGGNHLKWLGAAAVIALAAGSGYLMWPLAQQRWNGAAPRYALNGAAKHERPLSLQEGVPQTARPAGEQVATVDSALPPAAAQPVTRAPDRLAPALERGVAMGRPDSLPREEQAVQPSNAMRPSLMGDREPGGTALAEPEGKTSVAEAAGSVAATPEPLVSVKGRTMEVGSVKSKTAGALGESVNPTIVEARFADAESRRDAVALLRDDYVFQTASSVKNADDAIDRLEVRVPDEESARRVVAGVKESLATAQNIRVVNSSAIEEFSRDGDEDKGDARGGIRLPADAPAMGRPDSTPTSEQRARRTGGPPARATQDRLSAPDGAISRERADTSDGIALKAPGTPKPETSAMPLGGRAAAARARSGSRRGAEMDSDADGFGVAGVPGATGTLPAAQVGSSISSNVATGDVLAERNTSNAMLGHAASAPAEGTSGSEKTHERQAGVSGILSQILRGLSADSARKQGPTAHLVRIYVYVDAPSSQPAATATAPGMVK